MSSETERITYEVMSRHDLERSVEPLVAVPSEDTESHHHPAIDQDFINQAYMNLERGTHNRTG